MVYRMRPIECAADLEHPHRLDRLAEAAVRSKMMFAVDHISKMTFAVRI